MRVRIAPDEKTIVLSERENPPFVGTVRDFEVYLHKSLLTTKGTKDTKGTKQNESRTGRRIGAVKGTGKFRSVFRPFFCAFCVLCAFCGYCDRSIWRSS